MVGKEYRKRPLFVIITIAAKVTDRSLGSSSEESEGVVLAGRGGQDR